MNTADPYARSAPNPKTGWVDTPKPTKTERFSAQMGMAEQIYGFPEIPEIEYKAKLANQLAHSLFKSGYISFIVDVDSVNMRKTLKAEINAAPAQEDGATVMVSNYSFFAFDKQWSVKDVEKALMNTFPERML